MNVRSVQALLVFLTVCGSLSGLETDDVAKVATEFVVASSQSPNPQHMAAEYRHPNFNESGISSRYPDFLPQIDMPKTGALFIYESFTVGRVIKGRYKYLLKGTEDVYGVEILYRIVGRVESGLIVSQEVQEESQFIILALDHSDSKWKVLDLHPYSTLHYSVKYILSGQDTAYGKGYILNLDKAKELLGGKQN